MEVVELEAVQEEEEDGGPKPRERGREARETQISERAKFQGAAEGEGVSHAALPRLLRDGLSCAREKEKIKTNLPSVLLTTNPNPGEGKKSRCSQRGNGARRHRVTPDGSPGGLRTR